MDTGTEKGRKDKEKMLSDIAGIKQVLEDRKKELAALEDRLSKMQGENKGLVKTVAKLRALVAEREARIKDLETAVSERDAKLAVMETVLGEKAQVIETQTAAIQEKDATIQKQADTLNTGYYISGNKEFLKTHGIIKESGGVLGLGKTLVPSDLSAQDFTAIPIQQTTELPLACEPDKVKILSAHPESSYALESAGKDQSRLKILNADVFWKSRYLVVLLKC
jgi:archaellum component FlaC